MENTCQYCRTNEIDNLDIGYSKILSIPKDPCPLNKPYTGDYEFALYFFMQEYFAMIKYCPMCGRKLV